MGFFEDLNKGVSNLGNDILKSVDNAAGSNLSGRGSKNGILTRAGKEFNRSDVGRFVGRAGTDIGNIVKSPFIATSDLLRGDTEQAGRSLGKGIGAVARVGTGGLLYYAEDNKEQLRSNSKWTLGLTGNLAGTASASRSAIEGNNISKADLNDFGQLVVKGAVIGTGAYYAKDIYSAGQTGYNYLAGGAKSAGSGLATAGGYAKDVGTVALLAKAVKTGDTAAAAKALGIDTSGLPQVPKLDPNISDLYSDYLDGSKGVATVGGPSSYAEPYSPQASVSSPAVKEAGFGIPIMIILGLGLLSLKMRKK